jgi:ring-1,2-phenylacetyl-CoA epoxidase subunit PaaE
MITYTLKIVEIKQETIDTVTLCFKQPSLRKVKYLPGQYLTLIFRINGRRYIRPYSFSSAPTIDPMLEVTIKRVNGGIVSNYIHDMVKVGDSLEVIPPMGDFVYERTFPVDRINLWATGSGITPLYSIAKSVLADESGPEIHLFYGNRNAESTIFLDQIKSLSELHPKRFFAKHFHTQQVLSDTLPDVIQGRICFDVAIGLLKSDPGISTLNYICGAPGFKDSVKTALKAAGLENERVFSEDFELVKDPTQFENIKTEAVRLQYQGLESIIEVVKGKSILEAALDANIELPYSCQTGNCSTCKGIIQEGQAKMIGLTKEREDLKSEEYLLCCTYPISENIYIKID